ncbi:hypothetical protein J1N35_040102 [Gossypium stocksii]|uniref:Reverse transcriptase zinc-binding domain-containing protein n=1 Tax=Gossypium stocksii TaxID=47602 RepID=A0A9D3UCX8_9ROSI|nr:hypothetical protein J1N35_040102 [Gossypium stocksii]
MTNFERFRRYLTDDSSRFLCGHWQETALHAVRDCPMAAHGRRKVIPNNAVNNFFAMFLTDWVKANLLNLHDFLFDDVDWPTFSGIICWRLWKNQNRLTFSSHHDSSISTLLKLIRYLRLRGDEGSWVAGFRLLAAKVWNVKIRHEFGESNLVADYLAKMTYRIGGETFAFG